MGASGIFYCHSFASKVAVLSVLHRHDTYMKHYLYNETKIKRNFGFQKKNLQPGQSIIYNEIS